MPALDRMTILKVPAGGTAHFDNTAVSELRWDAVNRNGDPGSLWVYLFTGSDEAERYSLETIQTLTDLSTAVVEKPEVVREVQQALGSGHRHDVLFFTLGKDGRIIPQKEFEIDSFDRRGKRRAVGWRLRKHSALFSVLWSDPSVPLPDLWGDFRKALGVSMDDDPGAAPRVETTDRLSPVRAAVRLRDQFIARRWPTSAEVGLANGSGSTTNPAQWASDRREAGALLGAWSPRERAYRHPDFQFDKEGRLKPAVRELLAALAEHADLTTQADKTGWRRVFWMYGAVRDLAGEDGNPRSAAEVFASDPETVIAFARKDAVVDVNDVW